MILVRWCIPDMSVELRDQIRREVYITNEIIIDQEAQRARFGKSYTTSFFMFLMKYLFFLERAKRFSVVQDIVDHDVDAASIDEPNAKFIKIEKLLTANLSEIEMDSIIHGENTITGISGADC